MRRLRRTSLSALIWLTAAMTVAAGAPNFTCRCPNGQVKPFCFGSAGGKRGCCCDGACCGTAAGAAGQPEAAKAPCCGHREKTTGNVSTKSESRLTSTCCAKTLVGPEAPAAPSTEKPVLKDAVTLVALPALPLANRAEPNGPSYDRQEHRSPPPTDRVITLRHLLI